MIYDFVMVTVKMYFHTFTANQPQKVLKNTEAIIAGYMFYCTGLKAESVLNMHSYLRV
jgi:hypothetical protein